MNTIDFRVEKINDTKVDLIPIIDGVEIPGHIVEPTGILFGGNQDHASYYLFTSQTGAPADNGFHEPIAHRRAENEVIWTIADHRLAEILGGFRFTFSAHAFDEMRAKLRSALSNQEECGRFMAIMTDSVEEGGVQKPVFTRLSSIEGRERTRYANACLISKAIAAHPRGLGTFSSAISVARTRGLSVPEDCTPSPTTIGELAKTLRHLHYKMMGGLLPAEEIDRLTATMTGLTHLINTGDDALLQASLADLQHQTQVHELKQNRYGICLVLSL